MNIHSMTGYARNEGHNEHCSWTWEVRGVNGKGLDVRCRLPGGFEAMEAIVRDQVKKRLIEGKIMSEDDLKAIDKDIKATVSEAAEFAQNSDEPDPSELYTDILVAE